MQIEGLNWHVLTVKPQKEYAAERILKQLGLNAFVPTELKYPRLSRRSNRRNTKLPPKKYPLLGARYVMAGFEGNPPIFHLWKAGIVTGIVSVRGEPATIDPNLVKGLAITNEHAKASLAAPSRHASFTIGDPVSVIAGPFQGHRSQILAIRRNSAQVLVEFLSSTHVIELSLDHLEAA